MWKVVGIMQVFKTWEEFYDALDRVLPKFSKRPLLMLLKHDGVHQFT